MSQGRIAARSRGRSSSWTPRKYSPIGAPRFAAAAWVAVYTFWENLAGAGAMPGLVAKGYLGVELFFVLSGFILCHVYLAPAGEGRFSYRGFLWARIARPVFYELVEMAEVSPEGLIVRSAGTTFRLGEA